jgi:hypothetical protein
MTVKPKEEIDFHPDAWDRFERAAGVVSKSPPQHRVTKKTAAKKREASKPTSRPRSRQKINKNRNSPKAGG